MRKTTLLLLSTSFLFAAPLALACDYPQRADIANGATATKDEMVASQKSVKAYMTAMEEYLACIETAEKDAVAALEEADETTLADREDIFNKKYNAAVDEMNIIAEQFNEQVRAYKAQSN